MLKTFVGNATSEFDADKIDQAAWTRLAARMRYIQGDFTKPDVYGRIGEALGEAEKAHGTRGNVIFYLAVADRFFGTVVDQLGQAKLTEQGPADGGKPSFWRRVVVESRSATACRRRASSMPDPAHPARGPDLPHRPFPRQGHRSRASWRSASPTACSSRSGTATASITCKITVTETVGVETRGAFYEATGALRDMVPNHVFALLTMVAMEPPTCFDAEAIARRGRRIGRHARAQAGPRRCAANTAPASCWQAGQGLSRRAEVAPDSNVETYVAMELAIDNWRWPACRSTCAPASTWRSA